MRIGRKRIARIDFDDRQGVPQNLVLVPEALTYVTVRVT